MNLIWIQLSFFMKQHAVLYNKSSNAGSSFTDTAFFDSQMVATVVSFDFWWQKIVTKI